MLEKNPENPRKISEHQKEMLKKSLETFGDLSGIVFNRRNQKLVGGHQRISLMEENPQVVYSETYDPPNKTGTVAEGFILFAGEKHKYREVDWDESFAKAAMIAANQQGGYWDYPMLTEQFNDLDAQNFDLELLGFEQVEIEKMMTWAPEEEEKPKKEKKKKECPECGCLF